VCIVTLTRPFFVLRAWLIQNMIKKCYKFYCILSCTDAAAINFIFSVNKQSFIKKFKGLPRSVWGTFSSWDPWQPPPPPVLLAALPRVKCFNILNILFLGFHYHLELHLLFGKMTRGFLKVILKNIR
jgi:hypothetical protein